MFCKSINTTTIPTTSSTTTTSAQCRHSTSAVQLDFGLHPRLTLSLSFAVCADHARCLSVPTDGVEKL
eukprot:gene10595-2718_t